MFDLEFWQAITLAAALAILVCGVTFKGAVRLERREALRRKQETAASFAAQFSETAVRELAALLGVASPEYLRFGIAAEVRVEWPDIVAEIRFGGGFTRSQRDVIERIVRFQIQELSQRTAWRIDAIRCRFESSDNQEIMNERNASTRKKPRPVPIDSRPQAEAHAVLRGRLRL